MIYTNYNYFQWPLTGQKISHFLDKVALDDSFNRHACWKQNSGSEYVRNDFKLDHICNSMKSTNMTSHEFEDEL